MVFDWSMTCVRGLCSLLVVQLCFVTGETDNIRFSSVNYTRPVLNSSYAASTDYNARGMRHLYWLVDQFLHVLQRDAALPLSSEEVSDAVQGREPLRDLVRLGSEHWPQLVKSHAGVLALVSLGVLLGVLCPLVGLVVCCCRCAGRCGADAGVKDSRKNRCCRLVLGLLLAALVIAALFGLVASFVVNQQLESGVQQLPSRLHVAVDDVQLFRSNTRHQLRHLLVDNYAELSATLNTWLDGCGRRVQQRLANVSEAVALEQLVAIGAALPAISSDLDLLVKGSQKLQSLAGQLKVGLTDTKTKLLQLQEVCTSEQCRQLLQKHNISRLNEVNEFGRVPDVSAAARQLSQLVASDIPAELTKSEQAFDRLAETIQSEVETDVGHVRRNIVEVGNKLRQVFTSIDRQLSSIDLDSTHQYIDRADRSAQQYYPYRRYLFLALSIVLTVILFCLSVGLFCGLCGRSQEEEYGDDTCNRAAGAKYLTAGVCLYFTFGIFLFLISSALFLVGSFSQFYVCDPLSNPTVNQSGLNLFDVLEYAGRRMNLSHSVTEIVDKCHQNKSVYHVFGLGSIDQLAQFDQSNINAKIEERLLEISRQIRVDTKSVIVFPQLTRKLEELARSNFASVNYSQIHDVLLKNITALDLEAIATSLDAAAESYYRDQLRNEAHILRSQQKVVDEMHEQVELLANTSTRLQDRVKFNHTSLTEAVTILIASLERAQRYLNEEGNKKLVQLANEYADDLKKLLGNYVDRVNITFQEELGRCGPLSNVYNSTTVTFCSYIVKPLNGFWASVGWCVMLLLLCVAISLRLTKLYRRSTVFGDPLLDGERRQRRRAAGHRSRSSNHTNNDSRFPLRCESPPYVAIPVRSHDVNMLPLGSSRLTDDTEPKAPTLWDMNAGPPGYGDVSSSAGAGGEYERPPPYFFPGPARS